VFLAGLMVGRTPEDGRLRSDRIGRLNVLKLNLALDAVAPQH
jgi:hypothetical protein